MFAPPYVLPVLLLGTEGTLTGAADGSFTLAIAFGQLTLRPGGLSVDGVAYPGPVSLGPGQSVQWGGGKERAARAGEGS